MQKVPRLIDTFVPKNYELSLTLDRKARRFSGTVSITGAVQEGAHHIGLHAKDLTIESATFDGKTAEFAQHDDQLRLTHPDLTTGTHIVVIGFNGTITDPMHGLYPCYYEHDGVKKELLATQFESHYAREVFPCVDEPAAKATFDLTLTTESGIIALSNMPVKTQREEKGRLVTTFETTPRMSSYLLAFVTGELHRKSAHTKNGTEVSVWATPAQPPASLDFGLDIAVRTIDFFEAYFATPYPLVKSDHVALPDFSSAAMENWGLITYREVALLADPAATSLANKRQAATIIAHELSHQWFGNLVTMKWWNDLWLNESFANIMEYVAVDALHPEWKIWLEHASYEVVQALRRDSLAGVQSIQTDVSHPDEIGALFDPSIVYAKGGRLIRMLQTYIGTDAFQAGLKAYFKRFAYQNTEADDLWRCLSDASGQDISAFMNAWITQSGYPVVHVKEEDGTLHLTQEQFFIGPHEASSKQWPIPLGGSEGIPPLLDRAELSVPLPQTPVQLNSGGTAHFITHYSQELLARQLDRLESLSDSDRLQLLHEQTLLAQAGIISSAELIPLLERYKDEPTEAVWDSMSITLNELKRFVETDEAAEKRLRAFSGELAATQFERLGWEKRSGEPEEDTKFRSLILSQMLYSERTDVIAKAQTLFDATPPDQLDPDLRVSIMVAAVRYAPDQSVVDTLLAAHQSTTNSELQEDIAAALTATRDDATIDRLIGLLKDQSVIRMQDFSRWFVWLLRNRYSRERMWRWTRENWDWIAEKFEGDSHFDFIPRYVASSLMTAQHLQEYVAFFAPLKKLLILKRNIDIGEAELKGRVELIERDGPAVRRALLDL